MSDQKVPSRNAGGTGRGAQAFAGVAGAVACLGIGWAVGVRSAPARPAPAPVAAPITQPLVPGLPSRSDEGDDGGQWGTLPGSGLTPAQPGTGIAPPTTGSGPSAVASTSSALAPATTTAPTTTSAGGPTTNSVRLTSTNPTGGGGQR